MLLHVRKIEKQKKTPCQIYNNTPTVRGSQYLQSIFKIHFTIFYYNIYEKKIIHSKWTNFQNVWNCVHLIAFLKWWNVTYSHILHNLYLQYNNLQNQNIHMCSYQLGPVWIYHSVWKCNTININYLVSY